MLAAVSTALIWARSVVWNSDLRVGGFRKTGLRGGHEQQGEKNCDQGKTRTAQKGCCHEPTLSQLPSCPSSRAMPGVPIRGEELQHQPDGLRFGVRPVMDDCAESRIQLRNRMMPRRTFLCHAPLGAGWLAAIPSVIEQVRHPSLWISDSDPSVALSIQVLARHCGFADAQIFECKRKAIECLRAEVNKPAFLVTDYRSGQMLGDEFIRLARHASPDTKLILFSAVVGTMQRWIAAAGLDAPRPDAIVEKPDARKLMAALCQTPC